MQLTTCQEQAKKRFIQFISDPEQTELVISGYAGTGKSFLISHLLELLPKQEKILKKLGHTTTYSDNIYVTATTRKAARVIAELLGCPPTTIHSLLKLRVENDYKTGETYLSGSIHSIDDALIVIDEASYIDEELLKTIRKRTDNCKIVYLGDPCQLLPAKADNSPVFESDLPTASLTTVMRNDGNIDKLCAQWRESVVTQDFQPIVADGVQIEHVDGMTFKHMIKDAFTSSAFVHDKSAKIVAWTNARVQQYNDHITNERGHSNMFVSNEPLIANEPIIDGDSILYGTDEIVKPLGITDTKYKVDGYETDAYYVTLSDHSQILVAKDPADRKELLQIFARAKNWRAYYRTKEQLADVRPTYSSTVHKSQGSTYDTVFIDLSDIGRCNNPKDFARLMYVAISRAKSKVVLYGQLPDKYTQSKETLHELLRTVQ
jgi:exodeoxyribonuclease V